MTSRIVSLKVNGKTEELVVGALMTLLDVMRATLDYTSVKEGCRQGGCGSCSVIVDGELRLSCLTPIQEVDGCEVTTLEGLNQSNSITALQQQFVEKYSFYVFLISCLYVCICCLYVFMCFMCFILVVICCFMCAYMFLIGF